MKWIWGAPEFIRKVRLQRPFGERPPAPQRLLRLELREGAAECDWLARPKHAWDAGLPPDVREQNETFQTLRDAITLRELLFATLPKADHALFRVYRQAAFETLELIITGTVSREDEPPQISSLVRQAQLCGLRFSLSDGALQTLERDQENFAWHDLGSPHPGSSRV